MNLNLIKSMLVLAALAGGITSSFAQNKLSGNQSIKATIAKGGTFALSLYDRQLLPGTIENSLNSILGLSDDFTFKKEHEQTDNNGIKHTSYRQYYSKVKVENGLVLLHSKNGIATSVNGKVMQTPEAIINTSPVISPDEAVEKAKKELNIAKTVNSYTPELVLYFSSNGVNLAFKTRIDGISTKTLTVMSNVYVSAVNGNVIDKASLIAHSDVPADAQTYYSGMRKITTDSYTGGYRLRDNARKIETYNVKGQALSQTPPAFANPNDVINSSTLWSPQLMLKSTSLQHAADSIRFTGLYNVLVSFQSGWLIRSTIDALVPPSTYQNIKDGLILPNFMSSAPPVQTLPVTDPGLDIVINAPSYRGTFRKDSVLVSFDPMTQSIAATTLSYDTNSIQYIMDTLTPGTHNWTNIHGDKGTYALALEANPAIDVHWGMEQTHDFYKTAFNYTSYDNSDTSIVRNYYDGTQTGMGTQNNAAALPDPINCMVYGTGDGIFMNPVVSLDIEGHEFTHLITAHTSGLTNSGESSALNESFSDMMGQAVVYYAKGPDSITWNTGMGVVIVAPYLRSLSNPKAPAAFSDTTIKPSPDTYFGQYWDSTANADGHTNGGVSNKWFYLLAHGGTGTNDNQFAYNIIGLGMSKAQKIAFTSFTNYLTSSAGFMDAYHGSLQATEDIYGANSTEYNTVKAAWKAVGIPRGDSTTSVNNVSLFAKNIELYPNPTDGIVMIRSSLNKNILAEIYNITGSKVMGTVIKPGENKIDMSTLNKGVYIMRCTMDEEVYNQKIVYR